MTDDKIKLEDLEDFELYISPPRKHLNKLKEELNKLTDTELESRVYFILEFLAAESIGQQDIIMLDLQNTLKGKFTKTTLRKMFKFVVGRIEDKLIAEDLKDDPEKYETKNAIKNMLLRREIDEATEEIYKLILSKENIMTLRSDKDAEMWIYKRGIYIPNAHSYIKEYCKNILDSAVTTFFINRVILKVETSTYVDQDVFFEEGDKNLIPVENGILDLKNNKLLPFSPEYKFFNKLPLTFDPESQCPGIIEFFQGVLRNKEDLNVIQELFGFLLYKDYFIEKAFMFMGSGRNGKGKTISLMKKFIGLDNCAEKSLQMLEKDIYSKGDLHKKLANLSGDISKKALDNTAEFKKATGRDLIQASRKFKETIKFTNYAKFVFACNELPITYDLTDAFFNRWVILDFPFQFLPQKEIDILEDKNKKFIKLQDPEIFERISTDEEMSGLLNFAIEGLHRLQKNKDFSSTDTVNQIKNMWIRRSSSINAFVMDCIQESWEDHITKEEFRKQYSKYCSKHKLRSTTDKVIKMVLETTMGVYEQRLTIGEYRRLVFRGIKFKDVRGVRETNEKQPLMGNLEFPYSKNTPDTSDTSDTLDEKHISTKKDKENTSIQIIEFIKNNLIDGKVEINFLLDNDIKENDIKELLQSGDLFENPAGFLRLI